MSTGNTLPVEIAGYVRDTCLCLHLQRAARAVARHFDEVLRPLGLTSGQFSLLMSLNRPVPASIGEVSLVLAMDRTTLTANLKPLQRRDLVEVTIGDGDRRSRRLALTPAGRELLAVAFPVWQREHAAVERLLAKSSAERLRVDLRVLSRREVPPRPAGESYLGSVSEMPQSPVGAMEDASGKLSPG
jgi:DNA-binding MarR family transcriptional regulator